MKNRSHFCNQEHRNEIDGYTELGMEEEALSMIRATFDKHEISEEEFHTCVFALLQSERLETWKNLVKTGIPATQPTRQRPSSFGNAELLLQRRRGCEGV